MSVPQVFERIVSAVARRPLAVVATVIVLAVVGAAFALRLEPSAGTDTLANRGSSSFEATERYRERFGDDSIIVLVRGELTKLVLTSDLTRLVGLEGCISGNIPRGVTPRGGANGPCARLGRSKPVQVVYGPGTFVNEAATQITQQFAAENERQTARAESAAEAARKLAKERGYSTARQRRLGEQAQELVYAEFVRNTLQLALRYGFTPNSLPGLDNPDFVSTLVFDPKRGAGEPKPRFAYLFPNDRTAILQVRLRSDLSEAEREQAVDLVRDAVAMAEWQLTNGARYTVTGVPVVVDALGDSITDSIVVLLVAALLVMAATLALVFRTPRLRLLPLAIALAATGLTFGAMSMAGASLTMASIAVLPVLIGLAVDYAIQLQSRHDEARAGGRPPEEAARRAAVAGAPTIATAAAATAAGFLVLLLSPIPMVRGFGLLLVLGIVLAFACALTAGTAVLIAADRGLRAPRWLAAPGRALSGAGRGAGELLAVAARGAGDLLAGLPGVRRLRGLAGRLRGAGGRVLSAAVARPARVLAIGLAIAAAGWALDTQTEVVSDVQRLVPQDLSALRDVETLQDATGVSGEIDVVVEAADLTQPRVVRWMRDYQSRLLRRFGYTAENGCAKATLCPALSLPDLFRTSESIADRERIRALLDAVPPYFSQAVITGDRRVAALAFGIRLMPLERQHQVIEEMRRGLDPPAGVRAELAGLPVLAAEANAKLASGWRRALTLVAGLLAVALVLLAVFRRLERALVPLVPIALATGWSALVLFALRIPLNPMSATLGALVIAISTEFSVLLSERYRQERAAGLDPQRALERTYRSTGAAVLASGATAIAGFGVLVLSDIRMLRDFGFVTVVDLSVSLAGVLIVLPATLVLAERGELLGLPARGLRRVVRRRPRTGRAPA